MLTETGQVITLEGQYALVDVQRKSGCGSCAVQAGCGTSILARFFEKRFSHVKALNIARAMQGDMVQIELNESALVFMTFWTYLYPLLFMFSVIILASWFGLNTTFVTVLAVVGLAAGIFSSKHIIHNKLEARQLHPVVQKVIKS